MQKVIPKGFAIMLRPPGFAFRRSTATGALSLFCENAHLAHLATRFGTPLYVYSAEMIRTRLQTFHKAFRTIPHTICYSVKANSMLAVLRLIAAQGAGFDVVSGGELDRVLLVTRQRASNVVFSGVGKTAAEMELALKAGILLFNVESASELQALAATAARLKKKARIAIRVNPDVSAKTHPYISTGLHEHKFGVPIPEAFNLYAEAAKNPYLRVGGVSVHIGSQITDLGSFTGALTRVAALVNDLRRTGHKIQYVDAGGGLGIPYHQSQETFPIQVADYAKAVIAPLRKLDVHLLLEPGRSIVGPAGALLTQVIYRKTNNGKRFLIVDAAMNDLLRPSLYSAYHEIVPISYSSTPSLCHSEPYTAALAPRERGRNLDSAPLACWANTELTDVVGPICETGDFFARDRELPVMREGDLLAVLDTGAYGSVLASNYNTRGRAAEVLVEGAKARLIRRRETTSDQLRLESKR
ncbi:MAG: diaminopimelate decarboxylase [Terriglobales bacterium]